MKSFFILSILFFGISYANYSGVWRGAGVLSNSEGKAWYCDEIVIEVQQTSEAFEFGNFRYACGTLALNFTPPRLQIESPKKVVWKDQNIGKFSKTAVDFIFQLVNEGSFAKYTVRRSGDMLIYQDDQISIDRTTTIKAQLYKD